MNALQLTNTDQVTVSLLPDAIARRDAAIAAAREVATVTNSFDQDIAVEAMRSLKAIAKGTEESREAVKAPVLELGRKIDSLAREFVSTVNVEVTRLNGLVTDYQRAERKRAEEAERQRQAELARIEAEKRAAEEAERKRLAAIAAEEAEAKRQAEAAMRAESDAEADAAAKAESEAQQRAEAQRIEQEAARQAAARAEAAQRLTLTQVKPVAKSDGMTVREVWRFEVTDIHALYAARRDLVRVDPSVREIIAAVNAGLRDAPGLRIWKDMETRVRV